MEYSAVTHPFEPVWNADSRVLILGSFPSVKSREQMFYYGHPQNRFWKVIASVCSEEVPVTVPGKKALLLAHGIALWDVLASCEIKGSSDVSIRSAVPNDIPSLIKKTQIRRIFSNGSASFDHYTRLIAPLTGIEAIRLPSTSPANAAWSLERLVEAWSEALGDLV